jgi:signal transduction histidine kinase
MSTHTSEVSDEHRFVLATEAPTSAQRRLALAVAAAIFATFGVTVTIGLTAPFARTQVIVNGFVPALTAVFFVNDLITATLLFGQFSIIRSRALLALADGYFFTALMAIPFALTFPGAFSPTGLLGAGVQSSAWIYNFWHYGFPLATIVYAILSGTGHARNVSRISARSVIGWNIAIVIGLVCGITWLTTAGNEFLPSLMRDSINPSPLARIVTSLNTFTCVLALALLYSRRRSLLDLWIMVVLCAWITELALLDVLLFSRFTFGFYVGRGFSLITSVAVLILLLQETIRLYARLARSNLLLERERDNKLMNMRATVAAIAHEVRQPLTRIITGGNAAQRFLKMVPPEHGKAQAALDGIVSAGHRTSEVIDGFRALFAKTDQRQQLVDVNEIVRGALESMGSELADHHVEPRVELMSELPQVHGNRSQLQEVVSNLLVNALEAMATTSDRSRVLHVRTELRGHDTVGVLVRDSGPGIDKDRLDGIFTAFVSTKPHGMGLGLAICRMIIDYHGGKLIALSDGKDGASFEFVLPIVSMDQHSRG